MHPLLQQVLAGAGAATSAEPLSPPETCAIAVAAPMSRRTFGQTVGAAVVGSSVGLGVAGTSKENMVQKPPDELCYLKATQLAAMIRSRQVSAREVMLAHLAQIE